MVINRLVKQGSFPDQLSAIFAALADPTRRSILTVLSREDATVNQLAKPYAMSLPAISKHLKVLEQAGLISKVKRAQWRSCHLEAASLQQATSWLEDYRSLWETNLNNLEDYLTEIHPSNPPQE